MSTNALTITELQSRLEQLNQNTDQDWAVVGGKLHKEFQFRNFIEAFGFMTRAAIHAEKMNHHPEWFNVYKTVRIDLVTHDAKGISELDFRLAATMDKLAAD